MAFMKLMIELSSAVDEKNFALRVFIKLKKAFDKWSCTLVLRLPSCHHLYFLSSKH